MKTAKRRESDVRRIFCHRVSIEPTPEMPYGKILDFHMAIKPFWRKWLNSNIGPNEWKLYIITDPAPSGAKEIRRFAAGGMRLKRQVIGFKNSHNATHFETIIKLIQ